MKKGYRWIAFLLALLLVMTDGGMTVCASNSNTIGMTEDAAGQNVLTTDPEQQEEEMLPENEEEEQEPSEDPTEETPGNQPEIPETEGDTGSGEEEQPTEEEEGQETLPEDGENTGEEEEPEDGAEEAPSDESDEVEEKEGTEKQALAEAQAVTLTAPQKLTYNNNNFLAITYQWQAVKGAVGYELYYAIDPEMKGAELPLDEYTLLATTKENKYIYDQEADIGRNEQWETILSSVDRQNMIYRVRAVGEALDGEEPQKSEFSEPAAANRMLTDCLPYINAKRKAYGLPGSGDYVRFYLGDADGTEYDIANPINIHVGESIDGLYLWAVCADGKKVSYCDIRDAMIKYEKKHNGGGAINYADWNDAARYGFTWFISSKLFRKSSLWSREECATPFLRDEGNATADKLGIKGVKETEETMYLGVALNQPSVTYAHGEQDSKKMFFEFYVPVNVLPAESGVEYEQIDKYSLCNSGEEMFAALRKGIHDREESVIVLVDYDTWMDFVERHNYYEQGDYGDEETQKPPMMMMDNEILNTWLWTQYEEQDWMEPWAGDNIQDCIKESSLSDIFPSIGSESYWGLRWEATYLTTAEQEKALDEKIQSLLAEGGALHAAYESGNEMKKIRAAYDYASGIQWVNGQQNPLNFTAYSGIVLRKGSCESSALSFVRLCREMGVQARVIKDNYWGNSGSHAYNIVKYGDLWYYVDCTNGRFMKGSSNFSRSAELAIYKSARFKEGHPISKDSYQIRKVIYNLNGGTNAETNPNVFEPGEILQIEAPTRTGYRFEGWYSDKATSKLLIDPEGGTLDTGTISGDVTLYAKWTANEYVLSYDLNLPEQAVVKETSEPGSVTVKYDQTIKLPANAGALYKYLFSGWNTAADGSGDSYKGGVSVKNLVAQGKVTLYAQWIAASYKIKYDGNGAGSNVSVKGKMADSACTFFSEENKVNICAFKADGYQFAGWNTRSDGRGLKLMQTEDGSLTDDTVIGTVLEERYAKDSNAVVTLYAQWKAIPYSVSLYANDGGDQQEPVMLTLEKNEILSSKAETAQIVRNGYSIASWNTKADGKGKKYALNAKNIAKPGETISLYAQWSKPISYKITYDLQGGKNASKNPKKYTVESTEAQRTLLNPTKTGYTFVKWEDASGDRVEQKGDSQIISVKNCGNIALRAVWKENSYLVIYHGENDAYTETTKPVAGTYRYSELIDTFVPARQYVLKPEMTDKVSISAWTTKPNGKGKSYAVGKPISKLTADNYVEGVPDKGTIELYAKWSAAVYQVTYQNCDAADGVKNTNVTSFVYNAKKAYTIKKPTRTGYLFAGWTTPDGKDYFDSKSGKIKAGTAEDVLLTAQWEPVTYTVNLNLNTKDKGIRFAENAVTTYGEAGIPYNSDETAFDTQNVVVIPSYYQLAGWNTKANGKGIAAKCKVDEATGNVTDVCLGELGTKNKGKITLYAIWKPRTYTITYCQVDPESEGENIAELQGVKMQNPETYTYSASKTVKLKKPSKYGFVFEGWYRAYDAASGTYSEEVQSILKGSSGDIVLYGKWRVK